MTVHILGDVPEPLALREGAIRRSLRLARDYAATPEGSGDPATVAYCTHIAVLLAELDALTKATPRPSAAAVGLARRDALAARAVLEAQFEPGDLVGDQGMAAFAGDAQTLLDAIDRLKG